MGTEILRPQNCLIERIGVSPVPFSRRRYGNANYYNNSSARFNRKPVRSEQRKRFGSPPSESSVSKRSAPADDLKAVRNSIAMEKVTILRRGQSLDSQIKSGESFKEEIVVRQIRTLDIKPDVYAGSAFSVSPSPSSLPLPSFSRKKAVPIDDSATRDLRRLLRLDL